MASFPLPHRPRLDVTIEPQDARLRTEVDQGPPKMRRRFTAAVRTWSFTLGPITGAEKATLEAFYTTTLSQGVTPFDWLDETGAAASFRFVAPPRYRCTAGHHVRTLQSWEVAMVLEILP